MLQFVVLSYAVARFGQCALRDFRQPSVVYHPCFRIKLLDLMGNDNVRLLAMGAYSRSLTGAIAPQRTRWPEQILRMSTL